MSEHHTSEERLALHVPSRPMLVAGRVRVHFERSGFLLMPRGQPAPSTGFSLVIRPDGPACWIHTDVSDAIESHFGQTLSQELRCRVTTLGSAGDVFAYEIAESGVVVEKLAAQGTEVLDSQGSPLEAGVRAGGNLADLVDPVWPAALALSFADAKGTKRAMVLGFAPRQSQTDEVIEIDPLLECPVCKSAMKTVAGPHGAFFGCVRFPDCRGRMTSKQADSFRARHGS